MPQYHQPSRQVTITTENKNVVTCAMILLISTLKLINIALGSGRQKDFEFEASLGYIIHTKPARATQCFKVTIYTQRREVNSNI